VEYDLGADLSVDRRPCTIALRIAAGNERAEAPGEFITKPPLDEWAELFDMDLHIPSR
jgi:hypothetical protein